MKIKYFDKLHKKIKDEPDFKLKLTQGTLIGTTVAIFLTIISGAWVSSIKIDRENYIKNNITNTDYIVECGSQYDVKDIFILYKDNEIRLCRREQELKSTESGINISQSIALGIPMYSTENDYIYKFYDIKTNEMIATTDYAHTSIELVGELFKEDAMKNMNGYEFINLGEKLKKDAFDDHNKVNQEYIDDYIENKRFLGR